MAWLAKCEPGNSTITVLYGNRIERQDAWFCEAVWAGEFEGGDFDRTDVVAGSGARIRDRKLVFVSSGATVDRLNFIETPEAIWVSNSLACVMAATGAEVDATCPDYFQFFYSVVRGLKRYQRTLDTSAGPAHLIYFDNLEWDGSRMETVPKPRLEPHWQGFDDYHAFLRNAMALVATNLRADGRLHSLRMLGTLSSGYDSTTVSVLARETGCEEVISFDKTKQGGDDSGNAIAKAIGLRIQVVPSEGWRSQEQPEPLFIAGDSLAEEVHYKAAEKYLCGAVLFTGYHGDRIWGKHPPDLSDQLLRGDPSGLALTEFRLHAGFIHCPVPFWGSRDIALVSRISNSAAMTPWDVPGAYSRPICRRIAEEAGIPRSLFGKRKGAASRWPCTVREFLTRHSMEDYLQWLSERNLLRIMGLRMPPQLCLAIDGRASASVEMAERWVGRYLKWVGHTSGLNNRYLRRLATLNYCNTPQGHGSCFYAARCSLGLSSAPRSITVRAWADGHKSLRAIDIQAQIEHRTDA
jgi:hypothetical protein